MPGRSDSGHPVVLAEGYEPQPDLAVLRGPRSDYRKRKPTPADVALLAEVADSTYPENVGKFLRRYAAGRHPLYWIVNLNARRVEVYTNPIAARESYASRKDYGLGERVPLVLTAGDVATEFEGIEVEEILRDSLEDPAD